MTDEWPVELLQNGGEWSATEYARIYSFSTNVTIRKHVYFHTDKSNQIDQCGRSTDEKMRATIRDSLLQK